MKLLDIFKKNRQRKKPEKKKADKKKQAEKKEIKKDQEKEIIESMAPARKKKLSEKASKVLYSPHITEKATTFAEKNKYVFKVFPGSAKKDIKKSVEDVFGVDVVSVNIINVPKKKRRVGRTMGWRKGYKKAVIGIKKGQKIEILPR